MRWGGGGGLSKNPQKYVGKNGKKKTNGCRGKIYRKSSQTAATKGKGGKRGWEESV